VATVLLITRGTVGDLTPLLGIGSPLKARGHRVAVLSHCYFEDMVERSGLDFIALDTPQELEEWIQDRPLLNAPQDLVLFYQRHVLPAIMPEYELIVEQCRASDTVLVIQHNSRIPAQMAAEKLGLPLVSVCTSPSLLSNLPVLAELYRFLGNDLNRIRAEAGLPPISDWSGWVRLPQQNIASWPDWFAPPEPDWPPNVRAVGFIRHSEIQIGALSARVREFLDSGAAPVLITGGTSALLRDEFYAVCAQACQLLGHRGLLVTQQRELVPHPLPDKVTWFDEYIPFASLMPHLGAVIHHAGMNTLALAMAAGIPQLALASGFERPADATYLQRLGVAEFLPPTRWQPQSIAEALQRLMTSPAVRERCRELASRLYDTDPATAACQAIEALIPGETTGSQIANETQDQQRSRLLQQVASLSPEKRKALAQRLTKRRT